MSSQSRANKSQILLAGAVTILLGIGWLLISRPGDGDISYASDFEAELNEFRSRSSPGDTVLLSSLTSFEWSQIAIVSQASDESEVSEMLGGVAVPERLLQTFSRGPYLLFIDRRRVVAYAVDYANTFLYQNDTVFSGEVVVVAAPGGLLRLED
jgi:hypothetical protein